jgi:hypothetical protein
MTAVDLHPLRSMRTALCIGMPILQNSPELPSWVSHISKERLCSVPLCAFASFQTDSHQCRISSLTRVLTMQWLRVDWCGLYCIADCAEGCSCRLSQRERS